MSDRDLREKERAWLETGNAEDRAQFNAARVRMGLPKLPRLVIRHYIAVEHHGCCNDTGEIGIQLNEKGGWPYHSDRIKSTCSVELWPRDAHPTVFYAPKMKAVFYTEDASEVTCKRCLASLNKPDVKVRRRVHYAPSQRLVIERGERPTPVCGRDDSEKFEEQFIWDLSSAPMTCPSCRRMMQRGQRAARATVSG